ncbi:1-phosphofructokinase family hexose kinase [Aeromicrobium sp. CTD01-1L150]|uniref:1-phosphofructokinase family hexose kinase n=1 Tax=Aeromicrobium sp. CTD01-1L150 TaxID=3341830 RepID=UPI0035C1B7D5
MLVVTPNPCFDRTLWVDHFEAGAVARPYRVAVTAGGKGVNVLRTALDLGHAARLVLLLPREEGAELAGLLADEGIEVLDVPAEGRVRSATIVLEDSGRASVLNEPGACVGEADLDRLLERLTTAVSPGEVVLCSGSLPPGLPDDAYGRVVDVARSAEAVVVVDGARTALARAVEHGPDVVCPNLHEAEGLLSGAVLEPADDAPPAQVRDRALAAAARLHGEGVAHAIVTAGGAGAALVDGEGERWFDAHRVDVVNPIGAGDSFASALGAAHESGHGWPEAVRRAVATAGAAVQTPTAGRVDAGHVEALLAGVEEVAS